MSHLGKLQVLSLGKFKVYPQSNQSGNFGHMTRKTAEKPSPKFLNLFVMYWTGIEQEHCPCPCSVFAMFQARKLGFVPSESNVVDKVTIPQTPQRPSTKT